MVARQRSRRVAGKPPEDTDTRKILKALEGVKGKRQMQKDESVKVGPPVGAERQKEWQVVRELPYVDVPPLPVVKRVLSVARVDR